MQNRVILLLSGLTPMYEMALGERGQLVRAVAPEERQRVIEEYAASIEIVVTTGMAGLTRNEIDRMPSLRLICCIGVGYEAIDVEHAFRQGIPVSYGRATNADAVADHAFALILASMRRLLPSHIAASQGLDRNCLPVPDQLHGKKLGLLGLGDIGGRIAKRASGFDMEIGYHTRRKRGDCNFRYFEQLIDMASWCDILVLAAPGTPETTQVVDSGVLRALGTQGYLINVARGSLVHEGDLANALRHKIIKGVALDVYDSEPHKPTILLESSTEVLLSPHIAGRSAESMHNMATLVLRNIDNFSAGKGVVTPVPRACP